MGINKVQHPEWASPRCNNKMDHNSSAQEFHIDIKENNDKLHNIVYNNKFDQNIWNSKFDQKIWIQHWHRDLHHDHQDGQEEQRPSSRTTSRESHVHNNSADIITSMIEVSAQQSGSTIVKDFRGFIIIDLTESALHILSFRCSLIVPSKGVTMTRCSNRAAATQLQ